jgi:2-polyprenyl-6-methoxyphenol hydroxylase-like FAD-dependent oxidoreductase
VLNIGIVGAGVGGLSCALMLKNLGHKVTIFERQSRSISSGVGIQLSSNAIRILRLFDLEDNIARIANFPLMVDCINGHNGKKITSIPLGKIAEKKFNAGFYQLHRNDLISILKNKVEDFGIKINYGSPVNNLIQNSSNAKIQLLNQNHNYDFVIGADGINSVVRKKNFSKSQTQIFKTSCFQNTYTLKKFARSFFTGQNTSFFGKWKTCCFLSY